MLNKETMMHMCVGFSYQSVFYWMRLPIPSINWWTYVVYRCKEASIYVPNTLENAVATVNMRRSVINAWKDECLVAVLKL